MKERVLIAGRLIGAQEPPFLIAELSGNHNGSLDRALQLVHAAADAGAHAVKLQTYTAETMTLDLTTGDFVIPAPSLWAGRSLFELYREASTPWEWHPQILGAAKERGLIAFSTPFDDTAVAYLEQLGVPAYKVASFELTDHALVHRVASTGKPLLMSTGMATVAEIDSSVRVARAAGCGQLILLKCTSNYPADASESNLRTIESLRELFDCEVGLSDHTLGIGVAVASVAMGATVIEKHLTLARQDGGPDSAFSMEPQEFASLVTEVDRAWRALGGISYGPTQSEVASLCFRRSLYFVRDLPAGAVVSLADVRAIRPGFGLAPGELDRVIGRRLTVSVSRGTPVSWDVL